MSAQQQGWRLVLAQRLVQGRELRLVRSMTASPIVICSRAAGDS
jgi:hypothetical protein